MMKPSLQFAALRLVARGLPLNEACQLHPSAEDALSACIGGVDEDDESDAEMPCEHLADVCTTAPELAAAERRVARLLPLLALALGVPAARTDYILPAVREALAPALYHVASVYRVVQTGDPASVQRILAEWRSVGCAMTVVRRELKANLPYALLWCALPNASLLHVLADLVRFKISDGNLLSFVIMCPAFSGAWESLLRSTYEALGDAQADVLAMAISPVLPACHLSRCEDAEEAVNAVRKYAQSLVPVPEVVSAPRTTVVFDDVPGVMKRVEVGVLVARAQHAPLAATVFMRVMLEHARAKKRAYAVRAQHGREPVCGATSTMLQFVSPEQRVPLLVRLLGVKRVHLHASAVSRLHGDEAFVCRQVGLYGSPNEWAELAIALAAPPVRCPPTLPRRPAVPLTAPVGTKRKLALEPSTPALLPCPVCDRADFTCEIQRARHIGMCKKKQMTQQRREAAAKRKKRAAEHAAAPR